MSIEMKFGSNARGDNDNISDIDILKVCDFKNENVKELKNIHFYTKKRLMKLKEVESLFLIHLREEGRIISDESNWLKDFLKQIPNFVAKEKDILLVKKYLIYLLSIEPSKSQTLWWLDCLYVFLRDYYIKVNSKYNYYSFSPYSFAKLINEDIKKDLTNDVLELRRHKSKYRHKIEIENSFSKNYLDELKNRISYSLGIPITSNTLQNIFLKNDSEIEPYFKLRLIEGLYLNNDIEIKDSILYKFIDSPHLYSWEIKQIDFKSKVVFLK